MSEGVVKLALYKGKGNLFDTLIRWWTGSDYSHCELILPDGRWVTSSPRDGGVRAKLIEFEADTWDLIELPKADLARITYLFEKEQGHGYDWLGIFFTQILPLGLQSKSRWTCSEFCAAALGLDNPEQYAPGDLDHYFRLLKSN